MWTWFIKKFFVTRFNENENCWKQKSVFWRMFNFIFNHYLFRELFPSSPSNWPIKSVMNRSRFRDRRTVIRLQMSFKYLQTFKSFKIFYVNTLRKQTFHPTLFLIRNLFLSWPFCAYDFNVIKWRTSKPHFQFVSTLFQPSYEPLSTQEEWSIVISGYF